MKLKWIPDITTYKDIIYPCACEVKYDGEFVFWNGKELLNKRGMPRETITSLPQLELYGELYYGEGKEFYSELHSHQGVENKFIAFDTGAYGEQPYETRRKQLENISKFGFKIVQMQVCYDEPEMEEWYNRVVEQGYEGIVCKPLLSMNDNRWVKKKREFTCTLMVKGIKKNKKMNTIAVGTHNKVIGHCSLNGWDLLTGMISQEGSGIIGQDKENWYIDSKIKVEVKHNGVIEASGNLRNPVIKRIRDYESEVLK